MFSQRFGSVHSGSAGGVISHSSQRFGSVHSGSAGGVIIQSTAVRVRPQRFGWGGNQTFSTASTDMGGCICPHMGVVTLAGLYRVAVPAEGGFLPFPLASCFSCWGCGSVLSSCLVFLLLGGLPPLPRLASCLYLLGAPLFSFSGPCWGGCCLR